MKQLMPWIFLGFILRLILIPAFAHPDIRSFSLASYLITQKGQTLLFYDYLSLQPLHSQLVRLYHEDLFIYPPLAYLVPAFFTKVLSPLYPWTVFGRFIYNIDQATGHPDFPWLLYLIKGPYLPADFACLWLILRLVEPRVRRLAGLLWIFNPVTLYATYLIGQLDIYIALFSLLALYFIRQNKQDLSPVAIGIAAGFKPFPLFFLPFLPGSKIRNLIIGGFTYFLIILPYLWSSSFRHYALLAGQSEKLLSARIILSGSQFLSLFIIGYFILLLANYLRPARLELSGWLAAVIADFFIFSVFHPQWFVWIAPFLLLSFVNYESLRRPIITVLIVFFLLVLTFDSSLNFGILGLDFSLIQILGKYNLDSAFNSVLRSLFFVANGYLLLLMFKPKPHPQ